MSGKENNVIYYLILDVAFGYANLFPVVELSSVESDVSQNYELVLPFPGASSRFTAFFRPSLDKDSLGA